MEETKSIDIDDMVLGLFLDSMTTNFLNRVLIDEQVEDDCRRHPRYDPIPVSYTHLLPILVKAGAIVPKQTMPAKFPYLRQHDPHATCGYHAGYVGHSTEIFHAIKTKVQELINRNFLCFTPVTAKDITIITVKMSMFTYEQSFDIKEAYNGKVDQIPDIT
ncbi:hypothetical protein KIW84_031302 [Lathyrus oleraceus]|uniref:Uncharacterized protein n=1 Tax=Pisum sativum TaxID=3888 RepID=A0A9D4XRJ3_PEA|nr:hypothetical protein KIW84_031302 [Pisum sativum]